ncbi:antibiotic biosynthesis monooxygenase [Hydrogenophaga sp. 5NK40-0174]|uniref:antibiotic biosynthesis monooxygenase n=1 Tax=Hydrogenophaga sp. 5NK40-0174 TaxID=3127649 RepID=UPI003105E144
MSPPSAAPATPSRAVTVLITRRVAPADAENFETAMAGMMLAAKGFAGHLGGQLVRPGEPGSGNEPMLFHVVFAFDNEEHLTAWQQSPERAEWLARVGRHTIGDQEMRVVSGLDYWFAPAGSTTKLPPPKWKVACVTWMGIFPTVLLLFVTVAPYLQSWPLVPRTLVITGLVVLIMTWVVAPRLTRLMAGWLHASPKSKD